VTFLNKILPQKALKSYVFIKHGEGRGPKICQRNVTYYLNGP